MDDKKFQDLAVLDSRIPPNMMMKYQGKDYILKAGLEYKASQVFGTGKYGIDMEIIERTDIRIVIKATLTTPAGMKFVNFGECNKLNTPAAMSKYALHLAATRAECRVLRSATACGYVAYEEMDAVEMPKELPKSEHDGEPATPAQLETLKKLGNIDVAGTKTTQGEAKQLIDGLLKKGK
jgi:hypothetical protein